MAITLQGASSTTSTSITIPAHTSGDLILIFAYRSNSATPPTVPASSATVPTWITAGSSGSNSTSSVLAYAFATRAGHTSGTWTNATRLMVIVLRNVASFGAVAGNSGSSTTINYPALTPQNPNGTSVICAFGVHNTASSVSGIDTPPTGLTLYLAANTSSREVFHYSRRGTSGTRTSGLTSFSSANVSNTFSGAWRTWVFELKVKRSMSV
jgi:hypothetical protein